MLQPEIVGAAVVEADHRRRPAHHVHRSESSGPQASEGGEVSVLMGELVRVAREASRRASKGQSVEARSSLLAVPVIHRQLMEMLSAEQAAPDEAEGARPAHVGTYL